MEDIIAQLNANIGKESLLSTTLVKVLEYLGMTLDYSTKGKVKVSMYITSKILFKLLSEINGSTKTSAATHLFNINLETKKNQKATLQLFHHAKL